MLGVSRNTVSNWEREVHAPTPAEAVALARALGLDEETVTGTRRIVEAHEERLLKRESLAQRTRVSEPTREYGRTPRVPPAAYQLVYDHCRTLERAGVSEDMIEEARKLMSGETFNTLHAQMVDERDERGWVNDVEAAWAFIRQTLAAQGFDL